MIVEGTKYIHDLDPDELLETTGRCVTIDPGRRDLFFCVHENSTVEEPIKYRFTKCPQNKQEKRGKYRRIRQNLKPQFVSGATDTLQNSHSLNIDLFRQFLGNQSNVAATLEYYYIRTTTNHHMLYIEK